MNKAWLIVVLLIALPLAAQPVLTEEDLPPIGYESEFTADTSETILVDVGTTGGPQEWDFSTPGPGTPLTFDVIDPADSPVPDSFPESDYVYYLAGQMQDTINGEWWQYIKVTSSEVLMEGDHMFLDMYEGVELDHDYDPDIIHTTNPLEMGSTWENHYRVVDTLSDIPPISFDRETWAHSEVDAWGTLITPSDTFEVLRYVTYDTTIEKNTFLVPLDPDTIEVISYTWVTSGNGPVALVESKNGETDPEFGEAGAMRVLVDYSFPGAVEETPEIESWIRIAGDEVELTLSRNGRVSIDLYDVTGRNVENLVNNSLPPGTHLFGIGKHSCGVYYIRAVTPSGVFNTKWIKVR